MRVFFVGLHFKPDMTALDSRSLAGKRVDMIIEQLPQGVESVKTNLFAAYEIPQKEDRGKAAEIWAKTVRPNENDLIFVLGGKTQRAFTLRHNGIVFYPHPSMVMSKDELYEYTQEAVSIIYKHIQQQ